VGRQGLPEPPENRLTCQALTKKTKTNKDAASSWMLDSGATNHMAAEDKGFTV